MLDYKAQTRIIEEAHSGITWLLIPHINEHNRKKDYARAAQKLELAARMVREAIRNGDVPEVQGDGAQDG